MKTHVPLVVRNVSLDDDDTLEALGLSLSDLGWRENAGQVIATVYTTAPDPVAAAAAAAHHIKRVLPFAIVERVDEQFVALSDIAARTGLSHEAVRLWAAGKRRGSRQPFPAARTQVGQKQSAIKIWAWPEVLEWLKDQYCLDLEPDAVYLTAQQIAHLNAVLCEPSPQRWRPVNGAGVTRTLEAVDAVLQEEAVSPGGRRFAEAGARQ